MGSVLQQDGEGFLVNPCGLDLVKSPWTSAVEIAVEGYRTRYREDLHSVYLRGSVPKGQAVAGISDLDSFAVLRKGPTDYSPAWGDDLWEAHSQELSFSDGLEILVLNLDELLHGETMGWWRFALSSQCLCVFGEDLIVDLPRVRAVPEQAGRAGVIASNLEEFRQEMRRPQEPDQLLGLVRWFYKHLLRNGFLLVMEREGVYTRDLYPCLVHFEAHYPEQAEKMRLALEWILGGPPSAIEAEKLGLFLGEWLVEEAARVESGARSAVASK